jgi:ABC-2 type transport system ATP-binding protein
LYGLRRAEIDRRLVELTGLIDIGDALDRRIGTYSGGMKRRIDLAAALVHNPEVLFLDEPTTGLDPISRAKVWDEVRRLNTELGMTIFLTTQYLEEADTLAGRVGIIDRGRLVAEGTPAELKRSIGTDVIDVAVDPGQTERARQGVSRVEGVAGVTEDGHVLSIKVPNGAAAVTPLALALNEAGVTVHSLTLRTPTLDDVFLQLTGGHIEEGSR